MTQAPLTVAYLISRLEDVLSTLLRDSDAARMLTHQDIEDIHAKLSLILWGTDEKLWDYRSEGK